MGKLKLSALILGAVLFLGFGATSLNAEMKCGAGKCGSSMKVAKTCGDKNCGTDKECKCGVDCKCGDKKGKCGSGKCGAGKKATTKCGAAKSKCGNAKPAKAAMKCGAGKCGSK